METIGDLVAVLFIFCLGVITLSECFYHIVQDRSQKKNQSHPPCSGVGVADSADGADKEEEGNLGFLVESASHLLPSSS